MATTNGESSKEKSENSEIADSLDEKLQVFKAIQATISKSDRSTDGFRMMDVISNLQDFDQCLDPPFRHQMTEAFGIIVQLAIPLAAPGQFEFIFVKDDFKDLIKKTESVLHFIISVLEKCNRRGSWPWFLDDCLPDLLIVMTANMRSTMWCTDKVQKLTLQVLSQLKIAYKVDSLTELLHKDWKGQDREVTTPNSCLLGQYLHAVRVRLTRDKWQASPTFVESFVWMLMHMIKSPDVGEYLDIVLAPALLFTDSHMMEHKVLGIRCLHHIIINVTKEQLRWYGKADVVYAALKPQLYSREPDIVQVLHPTLLLLLPVIDSNPTNPHPPPTSSRSQRDEVLTMVMCNAMTENGLVLRRLHTQWLPDYISGLGKGCLRHMRKLVDLMCHYMEVPDPPEEKARSNALNILTVVMTNAWPRLQPHAARLSICLMDLLLEMDSLHCVTPPHTADHLSKQAVDCVQLLAEICPKVHTFLQEVATTPAMESLWLRIQRCSAGGSASKDGAAALRNDDGSGKEGVASADGSGR